MADLMHCVTILLSFGLAVAAPYVASQFVRPDGNPEAGPNPSQLFPTHGKPSQHFGDRFPFDPSSSVLWGGDGGGERGQPSFVFPKSDVRRTSRQNNFPGFVGSDDGESFIFPDDPPPQTTTGRPTPPATPGPGGSTTIADCGCPSTPEFNPVCGSDTVTYGNPGKLKCANICGLVITLQHYGPCRTTPAASTTTPSSQTSVPTSQTLFLPELLESLQR